MSRAALVSSGVQHAARSLDRTISTIHARFAHRHLHEQQFAAALRSLAASVRAGRSLMQACRDASLRTDGPIGQAFARCSGQLGIGVPHPIALAELHRAVNVPSSRLLVDVLIVRHRTGGDLGEVCHRVARLVDDRIQLRAEARSATAQARFTARAVLVLPILLVFVWWQLAPDTVARLATVGGALLMAPSMLLLMVGIAVIRRIAARALKTTTAGIAASTSATERGARATIDRLAGSGALSLRSARLMIMAAVPAIMMFISTDLPVVRISALAFVVCAGAWPWSKQRADERQRRDVVDSGIDTLIEVTIGLLSAGAPPRAAALGAIRSCPGTLGTELRERAAQIELGRSVASALASTRAVQASAELDGWVQALTRDAAMGAPASDTLERLLADVRMRQREQLRRRAATAGPRMQLATVLLIVPAILWFVLVTTALGLARQLQSSGIIG